MTPTRALRRADVEGDLMVYVVDQLAVVFVGPRLAAVASLANTCAIGGRGPITGAPQVDLAPWFQDALQGRR